MLGQRIKGWVILDDEYTNGVRDALKSLVKETADLVKLPVRAAGSNHEEGMDFSSRFAVSMVGTVQAEEEIQAKSWLNCTASQGWKGCQSTRK